MKKFTLFSAMIIVIMLFAFTSCQKDGEFNPQKKISRIFYERSGSGRYLNQTWTWDKNLLSRITDRSGEFMRFEYDKKRVSKMISSDGNTTVKFTYDGSKYDRIEETYKYSSYGSSVTFYTVYKFSYAGNKVDKITETVTYSVDNIISKGKIPQKVDKKFNLLQFILAEPMYESIAKFQSKKESKAGPESWTSTYLFTWKGDNVEKMIMEETEDGEYYAETYTYTYDKKKNPFYGLFADFMPNSKNNVIKAIYSDTETGYNETYANYKYDGNFPTERTQTWMNDTDFFITYYEYE